MNSRTSLYTHRTIQNFQNHFEYFMEVSRRNESPGMDATSTKRESSESRRGVTAMTKAFELPRCEHLNVEHSDQRPEDLILEDHGSVEAQAGHVLDHEIVKEVEEGPESVVNNNESRAGPDCSNSVNQRGDHGFGVDSMFDEEFSRADWDRLVREVSIPGSQKHRARFSRVFGTRGCVKAVFVEEALSLLQSGSFGEDVKENLVKKFVQGSQRRKSSQMGPWVCGRPYTEAKRLKKNAQRNAPRLPDKGSTSKSSATINSASIEEISSEGVLLRGSAIQRQTFAQEPEYLDKNFAEYQVGRISALAHQISSTDLKSLAPSSYRPFREYPGILCYDYLKGGSLQLPEIRLLRDMLYTPPEIELAEQVRTLRLQDEGLPDLMDTLLNYVIFKKLSTTIIFSDDHPCLKLGYETIKELEPNKDYSTLRKKWILEEIKSVRFERICWQASSIWASETNLVLSPLINRLKNEGSSGASQYDEHKVVDRLKTSFYDMLQLHASFEAHYRHVEYFWPRPGETFDVSLHDSRSWRMVGVMTGVISYTKKFGVSFGDASGQNIVFLKAIVETARKD